MSIIEEYCNMAKNGSVKDVDALMRKLTRKMTLATSKFVDYALGFVSSKAGTKRMAHYLFNGTKTQRNYATLYFGRKGEYLLLRKAYEQGKVDGRQAFSR